jgi:hypothetical protein
MNTEEKRILKELIALGTPQSPSSFINGIAHKNEHAIQTLMIEKHIETIPVEKFEKMYDFYRPTKRGIAKSKGGLVWFWYNIHGDIRNIVISSITALIITFLTLMIEKNFFK